MTPNLTTTQRVQALATPAVPMGHETKCHWPLHDTHSTREIEQHAQQALPAHDLMQRAGLACAQLALAIAPHAQRIWIACGPGNNGGDGLQAAVHLQQWGKTPIVTCTTSPEGLPPDAFAAWQRAHDAGVLFQPSPPESFDLAIDALLGIGCNKAPTGLVAQWLERLHHTSKTVLHIDTPSGLLADTGVWLGKPEPAVPAGPRHTLSLLTLKPGLLTAQGRDAAGHIWFNALGVDSASTPATAWLQTHAGYLTKRAHASHKGSFGDVMVVGGDSGMTGAVVLASLAALRAGAGRVYAGLLDSTANNAVMATHPALMVRSVEALNYQHASVVCGCGGGDAVRHALPRVLSTADRLVLDADALNAIAHDTQLMQLLQQRAKRQHATVLTPHPLEAARLLQCSTDEVQADRLNKARQLADATGCVVVLKGSGTVVAHPAHTPVVNHSGNAKLATAGTGDVLAGWIGALLHTSRNSFEAACQAVHLHGAVADHWPHTRRLIASEMLAHI